MDDARSRSADAPWHDPVRLGLAELATALGGIWHRAERRRRAPDPRPLRDHIERARAWQAAELLARLGERAPSDEELLRA
jgi:hypothetical protein